MNFTNIYKLLALALSLSKVHSFTASSTLLTSPAVSTTSSALHAYVPDGLTAEQYKRIQSQDKTRIGKDLGRLGPRGFKSRSMQAWQEAYERGEASHAFAPFGYREELKQGKLQKKDVPYMVRGGNWDNSDVAGARRLKWSKLDRDYQRGGYRKEQSASLLGSGPGLNWTGEARQQDKFFAKRIIPGFS